MNQFSIKSFKKFISGFANFIKEAIIDLLKERKLNRKTITALAVIVFLIFFIINIIAFFISPKKSKIDTEEGIKSVNNFESGSIASIERAIDKLDMAARNDTEISPNRKARYMRKFKNSIVIGDSLTEGLTVYGWLSGTQVFSKIGASVMFGDDLFIKAAKTYPKNAFFAFGMNDMGNYSGDDTAFIKQYERMISIFKKESKDTNIYICSISTPTKAAIKDNKTIGDYNKFNKAIEQMCKSKNITYIDTSKILPDNPELYAEDGIHADTKYYPIWLDLMAAKAGIR